MKARSSSSIVGTGQEPLLEPVGEPPACRSDPGSRGCPRGRYSRDDYAEGRRSPARSAADPDGGPRGVASWPCSETTAADRPLRLHRPPARGSVLGRRTCPGHRLHAGTHEGRRQEGRAVLRLGDRGAPRGQVLGAPQRRLVRRDVEVLHRQRRDGRRRAESEDAVLRPHGRPVPERAEDTQAGRRTASTTSASSSSAGTAEPGTSPATSGSRSGATARAGASPAGRPRTRTSSISGTFKCSDARPVDEQVLLGDRLEADPLEDRPRHASRRRRSGPASRAAPPRPSVARTSARNAPRPR